MLPGHENRSVCLAQTKFQPPRLGQDFIVRRRLHDVLAAAVGDYALTLVSALAGYGKTTLLASFSSASAKMPLTWLSLDEEDNDPAHLILQRLYVVNQLSWPSRIKEMHHYWQKHIFLYVLVFVSFFFMFHQFGVVPPPFPWSDEASAGQDAVATLNGHFWLHYPDQGGGGNLWVYLATLAFLLLEPNIFALRWLAGVAGLFAVVFFYAAGLELFRTIAPPRKSHWLAFLSALGLAVSTWHLIMSRVAWPPVLGSIAVSAMTFFLWRGLRTKRPQAFVGLGVIIGLSLYLYVPSRLIGLVVIIFLTIEAILSFGQQKPILWRLLRYQFLLTIGMAVIVAAPMLGLYLAYPDTFTTRIEEVRIQTDTSSWLEQVSRNLYFYADSFGFTLNLGRLPIDGLILGSITSILFLAGLLVAFWQISTPLSRYVLIWWFLLIIPGVVSPTLAYDPSILRRVIGILPVTFIFPVLALYFLEVKSKNWLAVLSTGKISFSTFMTPIIAIPVIVFSAWQTYDSFFVRWPQSPAIERLFNPLNVELVNWMESQSAPGTVFIFPLRSRSGSSSQPWMYTIRFLFKGGARFIPDYEPDVPGDLLAAVNGNDHVYLLTSQLTKADAKEQFSYLLERLGTAVETEQRFGFTSQHFVINSWQLDAPVMRLTPATAFGDALLLRSVEMGLVVDLRRMVWAELEWENLNSRRDYQVSVRLQDSAGNIVAQQDKLLLNNLLNEPTSAWPAGAIENDFHNLEIPPTILPGNYELRVLVYDAHSLLPLAPQINVPGQSLLLTTVAIPPISRPVDVKLEHPTVVQIEDSEVALAISNESLPQSLMPGQSFTMPILLQVNRKDFKSSIQLNLSSATQNWILSAPVDLKTPANWPLNAPFQLFLTGTIPRAITVQDNYWLSLSLSDRNGQTTEIPLPEIELQTRSRLFTVPAAEKMVKANVDFGEIAQLIGFDLDLTQVKNENGQVGLTLYWQAITETEVSYKVFVHLLDAEGNIVQQVDREPQAGQTPTTSWLENEVVMDKFVFPVDEKLKDVARIAVGLYNPSTGERLLITDPVDRLSKTAYEITF